MIKAVMWGLILLALPLASGQLIILGGDTQEIINIESPGEPGVYGEMYLFDEEVGTTIPILLSNVFYNVTNFTQGDLNNVLYLSNALVIQEAGYYKIDYSISFLGGGNHLYGVGIFKNTNLLPESYIHRKLGTQGDVGNAGGSAIAYLSKNDIVNLRIEDEAVLPTSPTVQVASFNLHKIS